MNTVEGFIMDRMMGRDPINRELILVGRANGAHGVYTHAMTLVRVNVSILYLEQE